MYNLNETHGKHYGTIIWTKNAWVTHEFERTTRKALNLKIWRLKLWKPTVYSSESRCRRTFTITITITVTKTITITTIRQGLRLAALAGSERKPPRRSAGRKGRGWQLCRHYLYYLPLSLILVSLLLSVLLSYYVTITITTTTTITKTITKLLLLPKL